MTDIGAQTNDEASANTNVREATHAQANAGTRMDARPTANDVTRATRSREARRIVSRLVGFAAAASIALVACTVLATVALQGDSTASDARMQVLELNAARADLSDAAADAPEQHEAFKRADAALAQSQDAVRAATDSKSTLPLALLWGLCAVAVAAILAMTVYLYANVVRPFMRLEAFADEVARGNLDLPLAYERSNPFGKFTWAFDNMRNEIKRARAAEAEAVEQNKTTVAALSHDIKTPIASIRAYSEALDLGIEQSAEERSAYARTIMRKCDEVTDLTDDLFLHALADLDRITVECIDESIAATLRTAVTDFDATGEIALVHVEEATVRHDPKRLAQALENLLTNARKYAPGRPVEVSGERAGAVYRITVRDLGPGMPPEDLPFAFDRFYRGSNAGSAPGAGLGLSITRYLVEQMGGTAHLANAEPGLEIVLEFPFAS